MNSQLFIDTWGWLTLYDSRETSHQEAVDCYQNIISQQGFIYTTDYVLNEIFTLLFKRLNVYQAKKAMELLLKSFENEHFKLIWMTPERFTTTQNLRLKYLDKPLISFTDLSSMAVMKELKISLILTGDDHFNQVGMGFIKIP
jgi:predicted nucleic acid-binding protein